jgi:hypothetical protein
MLSPPDGFVSTRRKDTSMAANLIVEKRPYPILSGVFLILLMIALLLVAWAVGAEVYPFIYHDVTYRFSYATLDRIYAVSLLVLAVHYLAYLAHYIFVGSKQTMLGERSDIEFSATKFVITWFFLIGLLGTYGMGASIATPALFDSVFGPARETAFLRIWLHTYFGFVFLASALAGILYYTVRSAREAGPSACLRWVGEFLSLRSGHRFVGVLNWILALALLSNVTTGFLILGRVPLLHWPQLPIHPYEVENVLRLMHDVGTAFIVASLAGHVYLRLLPGNRWLLKTMFGGYDAKVS